MHFTQYILMVCISTGSYENRVSKHFAISLNFSCLIASLLSFLLVFFFVRFVVRNLCRSGCKQNSSNFFLPPPPRFTPSLFFFFSILSTILYSSDSFLAQPVRAIRVTRGGLEPNFPDWLDRWRHIRNHRGRLGTRLYKWQLFEISARLKLASVPFST